MTDVNSVLKNAFIDSQLESNDEITHNFSPIFEKEMRKLIKSQKGVLKLINTAAKRAACIALAVLFSLTAVACSIEEVREPIVKEIQRFFVNARELLTGTAADEVSDLFPTDVTKIIGTSYISSSKKQYVIDDEERVTDFITLLSETYWGEPDRFSEFDETNTYWTFDFLDGEEKSLLQIKMCNDVSYEYSKIAIIKNGEEKHFYISNKTYREILAFTNKKYYLHDSKLEKPDKEYFEAVKNQVLKGLDEAEQKEIKRKIRSAHYATEIFLLQNVSLLKEKDSVYWRYVQSGERFDDPIAGYERQYDVNGEVVSALEYALSVIEDKDVKKNLSTALKLWKKSVSEHKLDGLFEVHEYIHDYDYYAFNYPTHYVYDSYADYQGLDDYFGRLED